MPKPAPARESTASIEKQVFGFIKKYPPTYAKLIGQVRAFLRKRYSGANELVYDYGSSLVIAYGYVEHGAGCMVSMAAKADGLRVYFNQAKTFKDPHKLLKGSATQVRYIDVAAVADLRDKRVEDFFRQAEAAVPSPAKPAKGQTLIKGAAAKQKSRR